MSKRTRPYGLRTLLTAVSLLPLMASAAWAQEATVIEEVIVTAERRAMALQDTPLSVIALSEKAIEAKGIEDVADLTLFTPNLAIQGSRFSGANTPTFSIRGIAGGGGATGERGVGLYIDGVYVPRTSGSVFKVFDLERIEVLRGPQGTLFGRNSTGGAIRLITKQPTNEFEGYVKGTLGNFDRTDLIGAVNIPLAEGLAVRAQAAWLKQDGYVDRGPQELGGSEDKLFRLQGRWDASDAVQVNLGFLYSDSEGSGNPQDIIEFDMRPGIEGFIQGNYGDWLSDFLERAGQPPIAAYNDPRMLLDDFTAPGYCFIDDSNPDWDPACRLFSDTVYKQADANIRWKLNETTTLTSVSGWSRLEHTGATDSQIIGLEVQPDNVESEAFYQEVQLNTSLFNEAVDLVVGANYFHEDSGSAGRVILRRGTSVFPATAAGDGDAGLFVRDDNAVNMESESVGVFASGTWHITDKLNFTGGLRWAKDKKALEQTAFASSNFVPVTGTTSTTVTADDSWSEIDWRATLDYHFTPDAMVYATASKAYRAGTYSYTILQRVAGADQSGDFIKAIPPEKVINYEAGARTTWFDNRLRLNPTFFYMEWTNRQGARQINCAAEGVAACPIGFRIQVVNSGDVEIWGLELDGQFVVTSNLSLDFSLGITDYKILDEVANGGPNLLPSQASPSYNVGLTYSRPMGDRGDLGFNVSYSYVGDQETHPTIEGDSAYRLPGYGIVNARLTWRSPARAYQVALFANNLLDNTYATFGGSAGGGFWDAGGPPNPANAAQFPPRRAIGVTRGRPMEFGITLQRNF
jgi:iron complex outermembrane recepter protein